VASDPLDAWLKSENITTRYMGFIPGH